MVPDHLSLNAVHNAKTPTTIPYLKYLNRLDLSMNNFGGMGIPRFIGSLSWDVSISLKHPLVVRSLQIPQAFQTCATLINVLFWTKENGLEWLSGLFFLWSTLTWEVWVLTSARLQPTRGFFKWASQSFFSSILIFE